MGVGQGRKARGYGDLPHGSVGSQLWLWPEEVWQGVSPRALTAGYVLNIFKAWPQKSVSDFVDSDQYDLWLPAKKAPWVYQGAPLLVPNWR